VGPTFYGVYANRKVTSVSEATTVYTPEASGLATAKLSTLNISVFPNPTADIIAIQANGLVKDDLQAALYDLSGKLMATSKINKGQTITYFDAQTLYEGTYLVKIYNAEEAVTKKIVIARN
jgi:hypothetical protein